ncbi:MAG TPA: protein kinase [Kofleriaceae bacterium]
MDSAELAGTVLDGRYNVIEAVARGAMGVVYRAERIGLGKIVAVKVMHDELPDELSARKRFEIEAKAMAKLEHPNCAAVLDVGVHDGRAYVVMDFITGADLKSLVDQGPLPPTRAIAIMRQLLSGVAHAHELGIIHRDIKPANIMISHKAGLGDHVKILDFGLARLQAEQSGTKLTTGIVVGTPAYMAPEQIRGQNIDARCDLYSAGVVLFELLTAEKPFHSPKDDPIEVVSMHLKHAPPKLADKLPNVRFGPLENVVAKALQKAPADRYQTATEMVEALDAAAKVLDRPAEPERPLPSTPALDSSAPSVSESMIIPQGGTRLGLEAHPAAAGASLSIPVEGQNVATASGWDAPKDPAVPVETPRVVTAPAPVASPQINSAPVAVPQIDSAPIAAPQINSAPIPTPYSGVPSAPLNIPVTRPTPMPAKRIGGFTQTQLAMLGGAVVLLVVVIGLVARGGGDKPAPAAKPIAKPEPTEIEMPADLHDTAQSVLDRAQRLLDDGATENALATLLKARTSFPESADLPLMAGKIYFTKLWWNDGLKMFREAIAIDPDLKSDPDLIKTVLSGFITTPSYNADLAKFLREDIGAPAESYLAETASDHPNAAIRKRATDELKRYQPQLRR